MKRSSLCLLLGICFFVFSVINSLAYEKELKALSDTLAGNIAKNSKKTVAVVDFTDLQGNVTELGRFIAEEISVNLTMSGKGFEVIDRNHLKTLLTEHKLSISGLVNPETIKKIGQISGVDSLVTGSVTPFGDNIRVTCKVIATDTAKIIAADKTELAKTKAIDELLSRNIQVVDSNVPTRVNKQTPPPSPALTNNKLPNPIEIDDFVFQLKEASLSEDEVTLTVEATNKSKRRLLNIGYLIHNIIIDNFGNTYGGNGGTPVSISCDGIIKQTSKTTNKSSKKKSQGCFRMVETYETLVKTVTFKHVSPHVSTIKSYKSPVQIDGRERYLDFYYIPLRVN